MTEQRSKEKECDAVMPRETGGGAPSIDKAGREATAGERARMDASTLSRRSTLLLGAAVATSAVAPVDLAARALAIETGPPLFMDRMRRAIEIARELREIRTELAACHERLHRLDPFGRASANEQMRQHGLMYLQGEAERRLFSAANSTHRHAPAALKDDVWKFAVKLHKYNSNGSLGYAKLNSEKWDRKREALWERLRQQRANRAAMV